MFPIQPRVSIGAVFLKEVNAHGPDESGCESSSFSDVSPKLSQVHRFLCAEVPILAKIVDYYDRYQDEHESPDFDQPGSFTFLQFMNQFLHARHN
jgi:hypothetical protein